MSPRFQRLAFSAVGIFHREFKEKKMTFLHSTNIAPCICYLTLLYDKRAKRLNTAGQRMQHLLYCRQTFGSDMCQNVFVK